MNNKILLGSALVVLTTAFTSCSDDNDSNPTLIQPTEFVLNTPSYINQTIDLEQSTSLALSWSQPKYTSDNAPLLVTYEIQVSPSGSFTTTPTDVDNDEGDTLVADYVALDKTYTVCNADVEAEEINKALVQVEGWSEDNVPSEQDAYIRVNAYIVEGSNRLNEIASNVVQIKTVPYYVELSDASPIMWYLVGNNIGNGGWSDSPGVSSMPMFLVNGNTYDKKTGAGEITYLNYFTTDGWKIQPADFNWDYGFMSGGSANTAVYRDGGSDDGNIWVDPAGYYLVTVNTGTNTCTIEQQDITPTIYSAICITGSFNDWADTYMTPANTSGENHVWAYILTVEEGNVEQIKFKIPDSWDTNWGFGTNDGDISTCGKGTNNGKNIGVAEGTWIIMFNDITGEFSIISQ